MQEGNANSGGKQEKNDCSDKSQIVIGNDNRAYIWRKSVETFRSECNYPGINRKISDVGT